MKPLAYSRMETDDELLVRLRALKPNAAKFLSETPEEFATRMKVQRKIVWVDH